MKEQESCEEWGESYYFGTYRGHKEPEEISEQQSRININAEILQALFILGDHNPRLACMIPGQWQRLTEAIDEKIDVEIEQKGKRGEDEKI